MIDWSGADVEVVVEVNLAGAMRDAEGITTDVVMAEAEVVEALLFLIVLLLLFEAAGEEVVPSRASSGSEVMSCNG